MACACKVNRDIERINSYYSYNRASSGSRGRMRVNKKDAALPALVYLLLLPLVPVKGRVYKFQEVFRIHTQG